LSVCIDPLRAADIAFSIVWAGVYVLILRRGRLDRTSGVPLAAVAAALGWEITFGVVRPTLVIPRIVVPAWLALDAGVFYQYLRHAAGEHGARTPAARAALYTGIGAVVGGAFGLQYTFARDWGDVDGSYSAYVVNVVMSLSIIAMLLRRRDVRGQSMYIALAKLVGSALGFPHAYVLHPALVSLRALMGVTFLSDVVYAVLLWKQCRAQQIRPWARV
jgi:hypothetical protein